VKVSIIIPLLNEEKSLSKTLASVQCFRQVGHEVIVVDGGSSDNSLKLAAEMAAHGDIDAVVASSPGRARQMNAGVANATGDVYLFLHADTALPANALQLVSTFGHQTPFWGRFDVRLSSERKIFRLVEALINLRSRLSSIATGDQAIFIDAELFKSIGGFPEIELMEDIAISRLLKKQLKPLCLKAKVITSSRRWEANGVLATVFLMWKLRLYYFLGVSPQRLRQLYR
jgi:rSAM/selenodomain-associated transferase 2